MSTTIRSTDLDFDNIKEGLKTYLQQQEEFKDYDFEASGLSNILDVLAYNTHINGLIANFAINESFITSAQLRPSVVSHAEALGYYPRSKTASFALLNLSVDTGVTTLDPIITLPRNTEFSTSVNDVSYTFRTLEDYTAVSDARGIYTFTNTDGTTDIRVTEGEIKTKTFLVGETNEDQVYVVPDENIDTSTLVIKVYDTATSATYNTYVNVNDVARIDPTSRVFVVREVPNGYYEVTFSDGVVLGIPPKAGNKIVMEYIASAGENANGAETFIPAATVTINGSVFPITVNTEANSSGGAAKESINSIKLNAPLAFAAQQRLVTAEDYRATILSNYSGTVEDVIAWGGNDNVPPIYGRVYVSIKFYDNIASSVQTTIKNSIINDLSANLAIMSIDTVFEDPQTTYLELGTEFNFNPDLTGETKKTIETQVSNQIDSYFEENLKQFSGIFRRSNLLATIDDLSPAILNSKMSVRMQQRFTPSTTTSSNYTLYFPAEIAAPDDDVFAITSTIFTYSGQSCQIKNKIDGTTLQIVNATGDPLKDNVGQYNPTNGEVTLVGFLPSSFIGSQIKLSALPANQSTVKPLRNYILDVDKSRSFSQAIIDYQNIRVKL